MHARAANKARGVVQPYKFTCRSAPTAPAKWERWKQTHSEARESTYHRHLPHTEEMSSAAADEASLEKKKDN